VAEKSKSKNKKLVTYLPLEELICKLAFIPQHIGGVELSSFRKESYTEPSIPSQTYYVIITALAYPMRDVLCNEEGKLLQQQRYDTSPIRSRQQTLQHEGRDDDGYTKQIESLQRVLETKKKNVATLRSQVGNMKTKLLRAGHQQQQHNGAVVTGRRNANATTDNGMKSFYKQSYHGQYTTNRSKEEDAQPFQLDEGKRKLDESYVQHFASRDDLPALIPVESSMVTSSSYGANQWKSPLDYSRPIFNGEHKLADTNKRGGMLHETRRQQRPSHDNDVMDLLAKLEHSADTIESLINQEEVNKLTIERLQQEIRNIKERMADKMSRDEQDLVDIQAENQRLTEQLCLQSDLIASLSAARAEVQTEIDDARRKLLKAEMEVKRAESLASRLQLELRESKTQEAVRKIVDLYSSHLFGTCTVIIVHGTLSSFIFFIFLPLFYVIIQELIRDLKDIHERLTQVKLDVTRLEYDCNIKSEEILTQNRSIERLVKENSFLRERGEFMSKELDCALSEIKTREKDHLSIKEEYLSQIAYLKDKVSAISEERKKLEESLCDEIKILEERNQRLNRQVKERQSELLVLSKDMDAMAREKYSLEEKMAQQEEEIRRYGIKNDVLSVRMREIVVQQTEAEAIIEELKSEIQVLTDEKLGVEEGATSTVETRTKSIKEPLEDKKSEATLLGKSSAIEKSYSSDLPKKVGDLAEKRFLMESPRFESHTRKEKNALVLARAYQVVQGIKGEAKRKDISVEDVDQN
jgi:hypothetical protein